MRKGLHRHRKGSLRMDQWNMWKDYLRDTFSITLTPGAEQQFTLLLTQLKEWNEKFNLVSFKSDEELLWRHFADSLAGLSVIKKLPPANDTAAIPSPVIDIGTGAGFPGIPVKLACPGIALTLVESITKKCTFLEHIRAQTDIDFTILNDRLETIGQDRAHREQYAFVLSRAVAKLIPNLEFALPLAAVGGYVLLYKTEQSIIGAEDIKTAYKTMSLLGGRHEDTFFYDLPDAAGQIKKYCIVIIKKLTPTPPLYPRRVGVPEKNPL
ncbi:MAG: 16S rRNA (guanine(527)-N(7))-methyltransferase RsmG [Elusimicrobia bacterium]|nr:16S rRNA (guanine(527)-N(7))-methyltransferase RsmG [Elusimicrobiota bacterium]